LTATNSIKRKYVNKDEGPSKNVLGHLDEDECFVTDTDVHLNDGRYDLVDGSDTCVECGELL
jgi:hypothetical protein